MALLSLDQAKEHLNIPLTESRFDNDVNLKLEQASSIVLDLCNTTAFWRDITSTWTDATVPGAVQAAVLLVLTHLHENRGDDMTKDAALWESVNRYLGRHKDPVIA